MATTAFRQFCRVSAIASVVIGLLVAAACSPQRDSAAAASATAQQVRPAGCDEGNAGLTLPAGFCASLFAEGLGHARHLAIAPSGDVFVNTSSSKQGKFTNAPGGFIVALRDADKDGHAEIVERFGTAYEVGKPGGGTGIAVFGDGLFVEVDDAIVRYPLRAGAIVPPGPSEAVLSNLPMDGDHTMHPFAISSQGVLYVNSGSASNSCQVQNRSIESPGQQPCRELTTRAGIWRYDAAKRGQTFSAAERFATGARNTVALAVHPIDGALYAAVHGRDQLSDNWPKLFTDAQNTELPAEVLVRVAGGEDFGWPRCYFDGARGKYFLAPEYGGDGTKEGDCAVKPMPAVTFPAHWAPEAMVFSQGTAFPAAYRDGAFVSFHGSWNRKPRQAGFLVAFVPYAEGRPAGRSQEFATGFAGPELPADPAQAAHRPMGLAVGPDGALYVSDDVKGRIWRIIATGR